MPIASAKLAPDPTGSGHVSKAINYEKYKMSNQQPPPRKKSLKPQTKKSKTSSTASQNTAVTPDTLSRVEKALDMMTPLLDFHQSAEDASVDDIRVYWDVRAIRGADTYFAGSSGVSTLPGALGTKLNVNAPGMIQQEVVDKIGQPLVAAFQAEVERQNQERLEALADNSNMQPPTAGSAGGAEIMAIAGGGGLGGSDDSPPEEPAQAPLEEATN